MTTGSVVPGVVGLVLGIVLLVFLHDMSRNARYKRYQKRSAYENQQWIAERQAAVKKLWPRIERLKRRINLYNTKACVEFLALTGKGSALPDGIQDAGLTPTEAKELEKLRELAEIILHLEGVRTDLRKFKKNMDLFKEVEMLASSRRPLNHHQTELAKEMGVPSWKAKQKSIQRHVNQEHKKFCQEAVASPENFFKLREFRSSCWDFEKVIKLPALPANWNELVAKSYANPAEDDFEAEGDLAPGETRLLAAEALRNQDVILAKYVLAICNSRGEGSYYRNEIGILAEELGKFVEAWNAKHGLSGEAETEKDEIVV